MRRLPVVVNYLSVSYSLEPVSTLGDKSSGLNAVGILNALSQAWLPLYAELSSAPNDTQGANQGSSSLLQLGESLTGADSWRIGASGCRRSMMSTNQDDFTWYRCYRCKTKPGASV